MVIEQFPPLEYADENGLIAVGGDLEVESLKVAYKSGIFPWPLKEDLLTWFAPPLRAVMFTKDFHVSKRLKRSAKNDGFSFSINQKFEQVVQMCAEMVNRGEQSGTWITPEIIDGYFNFHKAGYAHSIEAYKGKELVGGLYGVSIGRMFAAESMFFREANASKLCLCILTEILREQQIPWFDCQVLTPITDQFGAKELERSEFMQLLEQQLCLQGSLNMPNGNYELVLK